VHSWQPIGDYSLVLATGKGSKLADVAGKTFASSGPGGLPDQPAADEFALGILGKCP
jgi:hypothetical protein